MTTGRISMCLWNMHCTHPYTHVCSKVTKFTAINARDLLRVVILLVVLPLVVIVVVAIVVVPTLSLCAMRGVVARVVTMIDAVKVAVLLTAIGAISGIVIFRVNACQGSPPTTTLLVTCHLEYWMVSLALRW